MEKIGHENTEDVLNPAIVAITVRKYTILFWSKS